MSASGTQVDVNDASATRLLSRGRVECGRVESNHHSRWRRGYSALSSPVLGVRRVKRGGRSDSNRHCGAHDPGCWPLHHGRQEKWKAGSVPRNRGRRRYRPMASEPAVVPFGSPACVVATPPPPHRLALEACRPSCTLGPALCPALVRSLPRPARRRVDSSNGAGGIRTHGLELMRLARTAAPLPRGALQGERGSGRQDSNLRSPTPEVGGVARLPYDQMRGGPWGPATSYSPAGIEPAARGVEALCSSAELRGDRRPWNRTTLHRRIRAAPAQSACRRCWFASRREDSNLRPHRRRVVLGSAELRRV